MNYEAWSAMKWIVRQLAEIKAQAAGGLKPMEPPPNIHPDALRILATWDDEQHQPQIVKDAAHRILTVNDE